MAERGENGDKSERDRESNDLELSASENMEEAGDGEVMARYNTTQHNTSWSKSIYKVDIPIGDPYHYKK